MSIDDKRKKGDDGLKLRILIDENDPLRLQLRELGVEHDDASEYLLIRRDRSPGYISARSGDRTFYLPTENVIFIESLDHELIFHTPDGKYTSRESLKNLERLLDPERFMRVSASSIVAVSEIKRIEASLLQKFILHMSDGSRVDVTRSYYNIFRDRFNI